MPLISEYVDQTELGGGRFRNEIAMKPIAVREKGSLLRMVQNFADGDATWGHVVTRAPLRVRTANDGMRRFYPIPGDDTRYMEMGQPFVQIAGVWTQVSLGTPSRVGNVLTWTRPQTITTVTHGGHFLDLRIELLSGYVPENNRIAFPVGLNGLTRSGLNIQRGGVTVARLRPFAMIDAADPLAPARPISHNFTTLGGQAYVVLTLPSLTGMARPVIDPILELQPDATAGKDAHIKLQSPDENFGTIATLNVGENSTSGNDVWRSLIQFDVSSIDGGAIGQAATLSLWLNAAGNALSSNNRTVRAYRLRSGRDWVEGEVTWNRFKSGNNWTTAGCSDTSNDREATDIGSRAMETTAASGSQQDFTLTAGAGGVQDWWSGVLPNNGAILMTDVELNDLWQFRPSDHATAANRPKLTVEYTEAAVSSGRMMMTGVG